PDAALRQPFDATLVQTEAFGVGLTPRGNENLLGLKTHKGALRACIKSNTGFRCANALISEATAHCYPLILEIARQSRADLGLCLWQQPAPESERNRNTGTAEHL